MTERLYYSESPYECEATVLTCNKTEKGFEVTLDKTVIFPSSGGQLSDSGRIGDSIVLYASEADGDVIHICQNAIAEGAAVKVFVDIEKRRDHTIQHTGEHILSGLISSMFGGVNVGFHMADDYCTIDIDSFIDKEMLQRLELEANRAVRSNVPILIETVDGAILDNKILRKKAKGLSDSENVRIVYIDGIDSCTCCGTHCAYSGEVGSIAITDSIKYKQGTRIWFACGERAVLNARFNAQIATAVANRFSTSKDDAIHAIIKQGDELNALRREFKLRTDMLLDYKAEELSEHACESHGISIIISLIDGLSAPELKLLADKLKSDAPLAAVILSKSDKTLFYQIRTTSGTKQTARDICAVVNVMLGGKGGGNNEFAQGSAPMPLDSVQAIEQLAEYLKKAL